MLALWRCWPAAGQSLSHGDAHFNSRFKMVSTNLSVSVASLSDLLARYTDVARKISELTPFRVSEFYEDYHRVRYQLEKLQKICQRSSPLRYVYCSSLKRSSKAEKD